MAMLGKGTWFAWLGRSSRLRRFGPRTRQQCSSRSTTVCSGGSSPAATATSRSAMAKRAWRPTNRAARTCSARRRSGRLRSAGQPWPENRSWALLRSCPRWCTATRRRDVSTTGQPAIEQRVWRPQRRRRGCRGHSRPHEDVTLVLDTHAAQLGALANAAARLTQTVAGTSTGPVACGRKEYVQLARGGLGGPQDGYHQLR